MKKTFLLLAFLSAVLFAGAEELVNEKVLKNFQTAFPSIQNARWHAFEDYFQVYFDTDDMKCRIRYDKEGKIIGTTRYYSAANVTPFLKGKLAEKYPGKTIYGVTEISSESELVYDFVLEDERCWMHVTSDAVGQMSVMQKFKKG